MTSVLNYFNNSSCNSMTNLPSSQENLPVNSELNPETTILVQPPTSNQAKPTSTLSKRYDARELGDLLTKRLKTESTNLSENGSSQFSPTSKKGLGLDSLGNTPGAESPQTAESHSMIQEDDDLQALRESAKQSLHIPAFDGKKPHTILGDSSNTNFTRPLIYESNNIPLVLPEGFSHFSADLTSDLSPQKMTILESQQRVQKSLSELHRRLMIEEQASLLQKLLIQVPLAQELLSIPSFMPSFSLPTETPVNEKKIQNGKKSAKKTQEDEVEVMYGSIDFPFLSLSLPLNNNEEAQKTSGLSLLDSSKVGSLLTQKESLIPAKLTGSLSPMSDDNKQTVSDMRESLTATRAGTQRSESEMASSMKDLIEGKKTIKATGARKKENKEKLAKNTVEIIQKEEKASKIKKDKEKLKVKVAEKQSEKEKERQKESAKNEEMLDELYPARAYFQRRNAERRKNRWQIAQDDKLKNEGIQIPDLSEVLEGNKKKIVETPVGPEHQVDVCMLAIKSKTNSRRQPKLKWNPESHSQAEMQKYSIGLRNLVRFTVFQEKAIELLLENDNDIKKAIEYVRANKAKCLERFNVTAAN